MIDFIQARKNKVHKFQPKVELFSERGPYILKTVTHPSELIQALKLRYEVFHREMIGKTRKTGIDVDEFDFHCDHLVIIEKKTQQIIGTYRLNCSLFNQKFYSAQEFSLRRIMEIPGTKLELGRACIHRDFRKGMVINLLWRGIAEYMAATQSQLVFGCASIKTESARQAALLYRYFQTQKAFDSRFIAPPTLRFAMPHLDLWIHVTPQELTAEQLSEAEGLVPPLARAYLKIGAKLGGEPAYDPDFKCIDFLTILERDQLHRALWRKYDPCKSSINPSENSTAPHDSDSLNVKHFEAASLNG
ncbi:MAG: GNAT family N-acetyltransferase [Pseudobdellovibrionaceae bacterium]|jgi:putative hemolysin